MNKYEHGNWYCKPANEAEAREIIERAVASGAELFESVGEGTDKYRWDLREYWGVMSGYTHNCSNVLFSSERNYTIEQVREKFPLPSERVEKEPIYTHEYNDRGVYKQCTMTVSEADTSGRVLVENQYGEYDLAYQDDVRPLKTEREQFVERVLGQVKSGDQIDDDLAGAIYDALKSGDLKVGG